MIKRIKARFNIWWLCWKYPHTYRPLYKLNKKYLDPATWENPLNHQRDEPIVKFIEL